MINDIEKVLIRKKCKACGNVVMCVRKKPRTPSPENCATCKSLGVEKAIEQRLNSHRRCYNTNFIVGNQKSKGENAE